MIFSKAKKGQIGGFLVLGLVLVGAIIGYYQFKDSNIREDVNASYTGETQNVIRNDIRHSIKMASENTIKYMAEHGGYLEPPEYVMPYLGKFVPLWQACTDMWIPNKGDMEADMERGIKELLIFSKSEIENQTKGLEFMKDPEVDVNILKDKITVKVEWPMKYQGLVNTEPYTLEIPTMYGDIYEFYGSLAEQLAEKRNFEHYTALSIFYANEKKIPTFDVMTECKVEVIPAKELNRNIQNAIKYTISHTKFFDGESIMLNNENEPPVYNIPEVRGRVYNYQPTLTLADNYHVAYPDGIKLDNSRILSPFLPVCVKSYSMGYELSYPLIFKTKDPLTGWKFKMATIVDIDSDADTDGNPETLEDVNGDGIKSYMYPGDCKSVALTNTSDYESNNKGLMDCSSESGSLDITVVDENGNPEEGVQVSTTDCLVGNTDSNGKVSGHIKTGQANLTLYKDERYMYVNGLTSPVSGTFELPNYEDVRVKFNIVNLTEKEIINSDGSKTIVKSCSIENAPFSITGTVKDIVYNNVLGAFANPDINTGGSCLEQCPEKDNNCYMNCIQNANYENEISVKLPLGEKKVKVTALKGYTFKNYEKIINIEDEINIYVPIEHPCQTDDTGVLFCDANYNILDEYRLSDCSSATGITEVMSSKGQGN